MQETCNPLVYIERELEGVKPQWKWAEMVPYLVNFTLIDVTIQAFL